MKLFTLRIITPEKTVFESKVVQVTLPVVRGEVTILADHIAYIGAIKSGGEVLVKTESDDQLLAVSGGFAEFHENTLTVLADAADRAEDIDIEEAEAAKARAEELRKDSEAMNTEEYTALLALIERQTYRAQVAKKHHSRRGMRMGS